MQNDFITKIKKPSLPGFTLALLVFKIQLRTKLMRQCQEIKQNWTGRETLISFVFAIFDHWSQKYFSGKETRY